MITYAERSACIIESHLTGDGDRSDRSLCSIAFTVRSVDDDRYAIGRWVAAMGNLRGIDDSTLEAITDEIEAE